MKSFLSLLLWPLFFSLSALNAQEKDFSINGFIKDAITGEELVGTNILLYKDSVSTQNPPLTGTASNRFGYYVIPSLSTGKYFLIIRHLGYKVFLTEVEVTGERNSENVSVELQPENIELGEVIVKGERKDKVNASTIDVSPGLLAKLPSLTGEVDLFKTLELLPGVNKSSDISSGLYVRGGSPDQTLTLVDGVIVYNSAHLGNIASTFNSGAISDIRLIKGAFPAEYGGRLSSVLDIKLRSGTKEKEKGNIGLGLINSFATFEGPLGEKSTYMISGRTMYYDVLQRNFDNKSSVPRYNFHDVNAKINYVFSGRSALSISGMYSKDHAYSPSGSGENDYDIEWQNINLSLNWIQVNMKALLLNSVLSYTDYKFSSKIGVSPYSVTSYTYYSNPNLIDIDFKQNAEVKWHQSHTLKVGFDIVLHSYDLLYSDAYNISLETDPFAGKDIQAIESSLYFQNESVFFNQLLTNAGVRFYYFGDGKLFGVEPRLSASYNFTPDFTVKGAFAIAHQFLHLITRNDITLPTDFWYPSAGSIQPSRSTQYVVGFDSYWFDRNYSFSVEGFYRDMKNLYEFKNASQLDPFSDSIEDQLIKGQGEAYGLEFFLNKQKGRLTGWIGYTISSSVRQFDQLNNGAKFYSKYDRRHDISFVLSYQFMQNLNVGLTWVYASGQRYSLPPGQFIFDPIGIGGAEEIRYNYTGINKQMFPDYHKLDVNASYTFKWLGDEFKAYINLYNIYNKHNVFAQYVVARENENGEQIPVLKRITLFPFIPSAGISVRF